MNRSERYHATNLAYYEECPYKFELSLTNKAFKVTKPMQMGLLLEGYLFGFKGKPGYTEKDIRGVNENGKGGMRKETLQPIKDLAKQLKKYIGSGQPFVKMKITKRYNMMKGIAGEADFVGNVNIPGIKKRVILDLKFIGDIYFGWKGTKKTDYLQAVIYPYLWYKKHGELLDFVYMLVDSRFDNALVRFIHFETTLENFKWLEDYLKKIDSDISRVPVASYETCIKNKYKQPCQFLSVCKAGREFIAGQTETINFNELK